MLRLRVPYAPALASFVPALAQRYQDAQEYEEGDGDVGLGPYSHSGAPPDGFKNGIAEKGAEAVDITTGDTYRNTGTKAATVWTADAPSGGGSGPGTLHYQHTIAAGESSWAIDLPTTGYTHARVIALVTATPAADYAIAVRINDDATQAHYEGGDQGGGADVGGVAPSMGSTSPALVFCTIEVPFYRTTPLMGSIHSVGAGSSGSNPIDPVHWTGTDPVTRVTLRSVESADFTTYTARVATGGLIECWVW